MLKLIFCAVLAATIATDVSASETRIPVMTTSDCKNDNVGDRLAFRVREDIRSSASLSLTDEYIKSVVQLSIVCLDPTPEERGSVTRYSYSITAMNSKGDYDFSISHGVGVCGTNRVSSCAESLLADIDKAISELRAKARAGKLYYVED